MFGALASITIEFVLFLVVRRPPPGLSVERVLRLVGGKTRLATFEGESLRKLKVCTDVDPLSVSSVASLTNRPPRFDTMCAGTTYAVSP